MQTTRVPLPGGQWAEIRTPESMVGKDRRAVKRAASFGVTAEGDMERVTADMEDDMRWALIARLITAWSLDKPLPAADPSTLGDLDLDTLDALAEATEPHWRRVDFGKKGPTSKNSSGSRPPSPPAVNSNHTSAPVVAVPRP